MTTVDFPYTPTDDLAARWYDQGVAHVKEGNIDEAFSAFRHVLELEPESAPAYNGLGICLHFMGQKKDAEAAYRDAARLDSRFATAQQRTLMDRLATMYRHKFLRPGMFNEVLVSEDDDEDDD